jgi:hypothetical protein
VNAGGSISVATAATHTMTIGGNIANNGSIRFSNGAGRVCNLTFVKNGNATLNSTGAAGTNSYNLITLNMGAIANTLVVTGTVFQPAANFLTLISGTLSLSNTTAATYIPFTGPVLINANSGITVNSASATVNIQGGVTTLAGNLTVNSGILNLGSAANQNLQCNGGKLSVSGGSVNLAGSFSEAGAGIANLAISGGVTTLNTSGSTSTVVAPFQINNSGSTFSMTGGTLVIQQPGGGAANLAFTDNVSTGILSGGTLQIGNAALATASNFNINTNVVIPNFQVNSAQATVILQNPFVVLSNLTISAGVLNTNNFDITLGGNWTDAGTFTPGTGTVTFNGAGAESITKAGGETFNNLAMTGAGIKSAGSALTVNGNVSIGAGSSFDVTAANYALTIKGNWTNSGTFNCRTNTTTFASATPQTIANLSGETFNILTLTGAGLKSLGGPLTAKSNLTIGPGSGLDVGGGNKAITIGGNWTDNGTFNSGTGTVTFNGVAQTITKTGGETFYNFTTSGSGIKSLGAGVSVNGNVSIGVGTTFDVTASNFGVSVKGNWIDAGTFNCRTGTITFSGTGTQTITRVLGETFNNVLFSGTGTCLLGGNLTASANLTINSGATFDVSTLNCAVTVKGNWLNGGVFTCRAGTVTFNKAGAQSITNTTAGGEIFFNLGLAAGNTKTLGSAVTINGNLTNAAGTTLDISASNFSINVGGNWTDPGIFNCRAGTVTFNGSGAQILTGPAAGETFNLLVFSGSGNCTLGSLVTSKAAITIGSGYTLDVSSSNFALIMKGSFANNGTFIARSGTCTYSGAVAQVISGTSTTTFFNVVLNNAAGLSLASNENLAGILTITSGTFTATGRVFTLLSTATGTASIGPILGAANFAGNIAMQRFVAPGSTGWYFLGAPITAGVTLANWNSSFYMSGFAGSNNPSYGFVSEYTYNEAALGIQDSGYVPATNTSNPVTFCKGYWCYVGPVPLTVSVSGSPGKGTVTIPVTYTASGGAVNDGWNLISNPYPSAIDWSSGGWTKTRVANAVYVWNPNTSTYSSWVAGTSTNGGSNFLSSSQAFWVQTFGAAPLLRITESCKSATNPSFYKTSSSANENTLRLSIRGNNYYDETAIHFSDSATTHYDVEYDARKLYSTNKAVPSISTIADSMDLSINSLPGFTNSTVIPIRVLIGSGFSGTYSIVRDSLLTLSLSSCLLLEDKLTGTFTDLRTTPSYSFSISDTTHAPRFFLHIGAPISKLTRTAICPSSADGMAIANAQGGACTYSWTNSQNTVLQVHTLVNGNDTLAHLAPGIYTVVVSGNASTCGTVSDTFSVTAPAQLSNFSAITNVSCKNSADGTVSVDGTLGGTSPYTYQWSTGSTQPVLSGMPMGTYTLITTDSHGCSQSNAFNVASNSNLQAGFTVNQDTVHAGSGLVLFSNTSLGANVYAWNFGDQTATDSSANTSHMYAAPGKYTVSLLTNAGACSDTVRKQIVVIPDITTGIKVPLVALPGNVDIQSNQGHVQISCHFNGSTKMLIRVFDTRGRQVSQTLSIQLTEGLVPVPLDDLAAGVYLVTVNADGMEFNRKFVR